MDRFESISGIQPRLKHITALIGGGGKTTIMYELGDKLAQEGNRVLMTTTTHLAFDSMAVSPESVDQLNALLMDCKLVLAAYDIGNGKMSGIPQEWYSHLQADYILIEADGSRRLPLKYHAFNEPVLPNGTQIVFQVAGLSSLGKPVNTVVHRWELSGLNGEDAVTEEIVSEILIAGAARTHGVPCVAVLNQVDSDELKAKALNITEILMREGIQSVLTCMK